jgi:ferredoxin-nitrate reductase
VQTRTQCPYCGVGCGLIAEVRDNRLVAVSGDPDHPVNRGATCRKPLSLPEAVHAEDRALYPLWRDSQDARFDRVSWRQAIGRLAGRLQRTVEEHGPDAIAFYISGQLLTEDYYAAAKLVKGYLGTNNLDSNSRLCMSSAVAGYQGALGADGPPASYADIDRTQCLLLAGTNTAACHPIVWARILARRREGASLIVIDPRRTATAEAADIHLPVRPGTDLPLVSAMLCVLADEDLVDRLFVERHTAGFEQTLAAARQWPPARAAEVCGVAEADIVAAARLFGRAPRAMALWSMGINQSRVGTLKNRALINLCLATGNIGRRGSGPLSLTGQPNAMGGREAGGLAPLLPGYRSVGDPDHRAQMRRLWSVPAQAPGISPAPGLAATELVEALEEGTIKLLWIAGTNPVVSQPDARRFAAAMRTAELLVCQDAYHPTETTALAHVVLPAAQWPEKDGTMTNSERRVALLRRALEPPGEALPDWQIFARVGRALGHRHAFDWRSAAEVYAEYVTTTAGRPCDVSGLSHERLDTGTFQWPVPAPDSAGSERLYTSLRFLTPTGRASFTATAHREPADRRSPDFPLVLTTGRIANQWHTMTRTAKSPDLVAPDPEPFVELHPADATDAGVIDGELVRVRSRHGHAAVRARVSDNVPVGTAFAPFHWGALHVKPGAGAVNAVVPRALDPISRQAELKAAAIRVERIRPQDGNSNGAGRRPGTGRRLVVVGTGMAAMATVEALIEHDDAQDWQITMVGREPHLPYNRMQLSKVVAGSATEAQLTLREREWLAQRHIDVLTARAVRALHLRPQAVELDDGEQLPFDRLVLATGSRPVMPPLSGSHLRRVHLFRTLQDSREIVVDAARAQRAVVIGGGLLGLEVARGLHARDVSVTVVHAAPWLMERQLDQPAAALLQRSLEALGVEFRLPATVKALHGARSVSAVTLDGGEQLPVDIVVIAAGVVPEVALAAHAGLEVGRGIVVDDQLRTSAPGVYAVGECVQHRGVVYGLWAPLLEQAKVAGASIAGSPAAFRGVLPATTLKVAGVDLFCGGDPTTEPGDEEVMALDTRRGRYRRLRLRDGRLLGTILLGDVRDARPLREHLATGERVPEALLDPMPAGVPPQSTRVDDPNATVCTCMSVTQREIANAIGSLALDTVRQVGEHTRAGTGCGTCHAEIGALLEAGRARPLDVAGRAAHARLSSPDLTASTIRS